MSGQSSRVKVGREHVASDDHGDQSGSHDVPRGAQQSDDLERQLREAHETIDAQRAHIEQLTEALRQHELFTAVLAHDLRTPLAGVLTAAAVARATAPPALHHPLAVIQASGARMKRLVAQVLDASRIRAGASLPHTPSEIDLRVAVVAVAEELTGRDDDARRVEVVATGETRGLWDGDRLAQLFSNLIGNALQHGEHGPVRIEIDGTDASIVRARVRSRGRIAASMRERLFEAWGTGAPRSGGLGLGLFIARHIARGHGGDLELESAGDDGETVFALTLARRDDVAGERRPG